MNSIACPKCGKNLQVPEAAFGRSAKCRYCGAGFVVCRPDNPRPAAATAVTPPPIHPPIDRGSWPHTPTLAAAATHRRSPRWPPSAATIAALAPVVVITLVAIVGIIMSLVSRLPLSTEQIVEQTEASIATVKGDAGSGTGFLVAPRLLCTNWHVIAAEPIGSLTIHFPSAAPSLAGPVKAKLVWENKEQDLAFLQVETQLAPLRLATDSPFRRGQEIVVIGSPGVSEELTLRNAISKGVLSTETKIEGQPYYQLGISINPGNSGGPVLNDRGQVVGVVALKAIWQEGLAFCVPLAELRQAVEHARAATPADMAMAESRHRLRAALVSVATVAEMYRQRMRAMVSVMELAIDSGLSVNRGLEYAQEKLGELPGRAEFESLSREMPRVGGDASVSVSLRRTLGAYWACCREFQSYVSDPRGNLVTYRRKLDELSAELDRISESLDLPSP